MQAAIPHANADLAAENATIPHRNGPSGRPENGIQPHGSSFFGNRGRIDAVAHAADQTATFGHAGGPGPPWPPVATYGHLWPPLYSQVAHCYALVKNLHAGDRPRPHRAHN